MKNYGHKSACSRDEPGWYQYMGERQRRQELKRESRRVVRRQGRRLERVAA